MTGQRLPVGTAARGHRGRAPRRCARPPGTTFRWKADDLDAAGLQTRIGASSLTLGGLLKHLAAVDDYIFTTS